MLTTHQQEKVSDLLEYLDTNNEVILTGSPGCGKTFTIGNLIENLMGDVVVTATTNKATGIIEQDLGTKVKTIYSHLALGVDYNYINNTSKLFKTRYRHGYKNYFLIIDEASMINEELYKHIEEDIKNNKTKVIYVGDKNQLPPVKSKFSIFNTDIPQVELTEIVRQKQGNSIINTSHNYKQHIANKSYNFKSIITSNNVEIIEDPEIMKDIISEQYLSNSVEDLKALTYTNDSVHQYNGFIRDVLLLQMLIGGNALDSEFPSVNEVVVTNNSFMGNKGSKLLIPNESHITILDVVNDSIHVDDVEYTYKTLEVKTPNYEHYRVAYMEPDSLKKIKKNLIKSYKEGNIKYSDVKDIMESFIDIRPVYSTTVHKSQGSTYNTVFMDLHDILSCKDKDTIARLIYVGLTRAKDKVYVFGNH